MIIMLKKLITLSQTRSCLPPKIFFPFSTGFNAHIDYFKVLELPKQATVQQIKAAFLAKAKQFHPDVNPKYEERFKMINQAYKILSDQNIRRQYEKIRQSVESNEKQFGIYNDPAKQKQSDPVLKQIERNVNYFHLLRNQALNTHIANQYRPKSAKQKSTLTEKAKNQGKGSEKFLRVLIGSTFVISTIIIIEIGYALVKQQDKKVQLT